MSHSGIDRDTVRIAFDSASPHWSVISLIVEAADSAFDLYPQSGQLERVNSGHTTPVTNPDIKTATMD
jgi:hypothetical protein